MKRISTVGPKSGSVQSGPVDGYLRPDQFLDHLTVIITIICYFKMITALDVSQSIGAGAGLATSAKWNSAFSKTLAR